MELPHRSPLYVTRRELLKLSGMLAASSLLSACGITPTAEPPTPKVDLASKSVFYPQNFVARARKYYDPCSIITCPPSWESAPTYDKWAQYQISRVIQEAQPWMKMSYGELWDLVFSHDLLRADNISQTDCPICCQVADWEINAIDLPWKVRCSKCRNDFPTNDFKSFYLNNRDCYGRFISNNSPQIDCQIGEFVDNCTGCRYKDETYHFIATYLLVGQWRQLILHGIKRLSVAYLLTGEVDYARRTVILLDRVADFYPCFSTTDSKQYVGADNNYPGYVSVWPLSCDETLELALAYDRIVDIIDDSILRNDDPLFKMYKEKKNSFNGLKMKSSAKDIIENIRCGILLDPVNQTNNALNNIDGSVLSKNHQKYKSSKMWANYPRMWINTIIIETVLNWKKETNRNTIIDHIKNIIAESTQKDGMTGEKGLGNYSQDGPKSIMQLLSLFSQIDDDILKNLLIEHNVPNCEDSLQKRIIDCFRFYLDSWCLESYYPNIGDSYDFGNNYEKSLLPNWFTGTPIIPSICERRLSTKEGCCTFVDSIKMKALTPCPTSSPTNQSNILRLCYDYSWNAPSIKPSSHSLLWKLYEITKEPILVEILRKQIFEPTDVNLLPFDLFERNSADVIKGITLVIKQLGKNIDNDNYYIDVGSVNKLKWRLSVLRGKSTAVWLHYASGIGVGHGHYEGINLGLFAKGLDLLPDFGYPPVDKYGGWDSPQTHWYQMAPAHNTVVVDGDYYPEGEADCTCWLGDEDAGGVRDDPKTAFRAIRVSGPSMIEATTVGTAKQFERTVALVDIPETGDSYVVDIFRVVGGHDHAYFFHTYFAEEPTTHCLEYCDQTPQGYNSLIPSKTLGETCESELCDNFCFEYCKHLTNIGVEENKILVLKEECAQMCDKKSSSRPMQNFKGARLAGSGSWVVDWKIKTDSDTNVRYTGLTKDAELYLGNLWVVGDGGLIPCMAVRRKIAGDQQSSTFVGIIEAHGGSPKITNVRRLRLQTQNGIDYPDSFVAIEITIEVRAEGGGLKQYRDLIIAADVEDPLGMAPANRSKEGMLVEDTFWKGKSKYDAELLWI